MKSSEALAELDFKITKVNLSGVAPGDPPQIPINSIEVKLKSIEAVAELDFNFTEVALTWSCTGTRRRKITLR